MPFIGRLENTRGSKTLRDHVRGAIEALFSLASKFMQVATREDADDIARLDMQLFPEDCFNERTIANELAADLSWVVREDDELAGYAIVRPDGDVVDLLRLGVRPKYRRQGWGWGLLKLVSATCRRPVMLTVRKNNRVAIRLYLRARFEIVGQLEAYGEQSWVMLLTSWLM